MHIQNSFYYCGGQKQRCLHLLRQEELKFSRKLNLKWRHLLNSIQKYYAVAHVVSKMSFGRKLFCIITPTFFKYMNSFILRTFNHCVRTFTKNDLLVLPDLKIVDLRFSLTTDKDLSFHVTSGGFPEMNPGRMSFFNLSILDMQWKNQDCSMCQVVQTNDLLIYFNPF